MASLRLHSSLNLDYNHKNKHSNSTTSRRVKFNEGVKVRRHLHKADMSLQEIQSAWYSNLELKRDAANLKSGKDWQLFLKLSSVEMLYLPPPEELDSEFQTQLIHLAVSLRSRNDNNNNNEPLPPLANCSASTFSSSFSSLPSASSSSSSLSPPDSPAFVKEDYYHNTSFSNASPTTGWKNSCCPPNRRGGLLQQQRKNEASEKALREINQTMMESLSSPKYSKRRYFRSKSDPMLPPF